jgi:phospholipase C
MVLISPWITQGLRIGEPATAHYEHSSLSATLINLLIPDMPFLTKRDAWAAPYDWVVNTESSPRTDCITTLPLAPITD